MARVITSVSPAQPIQFEFLYPSYNVIAEVRKPILDTVPSHPRVPWVNADETQPLVPF